MNRVFVLGLLLLAFAGDVAADVTVSTDSLRLTFSDDGGLQSAIACFPACSAENTRIQQFGDGGVIRPRGAPSGSWRRTSDRADGHYLLSFLHPSGASLTWRIPERGYRLSLETRAVGGLSLQSGEAFRPREAAGFGVWLEQSRYLVLKDGDVEQVGLDEESGEVIGDVDWAGYRNRYWTALVAPGDVSSVGLETSEDRRDAALDFRSDSSEWLIYLGPVEPRVLSQAARGLDGILYAGLWFWLRWICFGLYYLLGWIQTVVPSWGIAIMFLSLAVNILMMPLSRIADRFQQQVNETEARLAPELQRIKREFKGEEQAAKILALYKTERVHPLYSLKSLMGVAVVIPVFIGAFDMLAENIHLLHTGFLWISDLSHPDALAALPFSLPFFGTDFNLLPFLMTGLSVVASALHNPLAPNAELRSRQVRNMLLLALAFFVLFYTFPAGMVLYWTTNNLISVTKSLWARR